MRTFLAAIFDPPVFEPVLRARDALKGRAGGGFQWTRAEQAHLTLRFLGEIPDESAGPMGEVIAAAVAGLKPFPLHISVFGAFPEPAKARTVWLGMEDPQGGLPALLAALNAALAPFPVRWEEKRAFVPHLTLGRHQGLGTDLTQALLGTPKPHPSEHLLAGVCLFRSDRGPAGTRHTRLAEALLQG